MRYSLVLSFALVLQMFPSATVANGGSQGNTMNQCRGMTQEATKLAVELFQKNRPPDSLRDYEVNSKARGKEILVNFTRKSSIRLGDHPFVIYDCEKRTGRYFEGE